MYELKSGENHSLNREDMFKAEAKCREARKLVKKSSEEKNPEMMYQALELYSEASAIYPRLIEPYLSIAYICVEYGELSKAAQLLNKVLEFDPSNKKAHKLIEKVNSSKKEKIKSSLKTNQNIEKSTENINEKPLKSLNRVKSINETLAEKENITNKPEATSVELKAKIKGQNFNILSELFTTQDKTAPVKESPLEKTVSKNQLTKEKIEELEKLKNTMSKDVKMKIGLNSLFMNTFKK